MRSRIDRSQRRIGDDGPRTLQVSFADLTFGWVKGTRDGYYDRTGALAVAVFEPSYPNRVRLRARPQGQQSTEAV
jgi:hypothetical protein